MGNLYRVTQSQLAPLKAWGFPFHLLKKTYFFMLRRQKEPPGILAYKSYNQV